MKTLHYLLLKNESEEKWHHSLSALPQGLLARRAALVHKRERRIADLLKNATELEGSGFVDIPGIAVDDRTVSVRVIAEPTDTVAIADSDGNVLYLRKPVADKSTQAL